MSSTFKLWPYLLVLLFANQICYAQDFKLDYSAPDTNSTGQGHEVTKSPSAPARKPTLLFGRIEEIAAGRGAKLPIQLKALTPKLDTSATTLSASTQIYQARAVTQPASFPVDLRGVWGGTLKVHSAEFDPICWKFDADEANKEREILKPGTTGDVTFEFKQSGNRIDLEPSQVLIQVPLSRTRYAESINQILSASGLSSGVQGNDAMSMMANVPILYAIHLGNLVQGVGVTGNTLQARLLKNDVKQLAAGVIEQVVVTYNADRSSANGQVRYSYSESVLRFYRQNASQLYVQAAMVSYLQDGRFKDKVIMVGTVTRGQATQPASPGSLESLLKGWP